MIFCNCSAVMFICLFKGVLEYVSTKISPTLSLEYFNKPCELIVFSQVLFCLRWYCAKCTQGVQ